MIIDVLLSLSTFYISRCSVGAIQEFNGSGKKSPPAAAAHLGTIIAREIMDKCERIHKVENVNLQLLLPRYGLCSWNQEH